MIQHYIVFPNHLRPSCSKKGLRKGKILSPRNFKDRLMLTDVGDNFLKTVRRKGSQPNIRLTWERDYFPWSMIIELGEVSFKLSAEMIGTSTWQSLIEISPDFKNGPSSIGVVDDVLTRFRKRLGRHPWESPYWSENDIVELYNVKGYSLNDIKQTWTNGFHL